MAKYFAAAATIALVVPAAAADLKSYTTREGNVVAVLTGQIAPGDANQLSGIIRTANGATKFVSGVRLNSPGGDLGEGVKLADIVRDAKMATVVPNGATCASACFIIFAAGTEKYVSNNASIGVHGASENGSETADSSAATIAMARIIKDLGTPSTVIGKMVVTPPSEIVWLTPNDLRAMGTTMTGRPSQLATSPPSSGMPQQLSQGMSAGFQAQPVSPPTWKSVTDNAIALSAKQNNGTPSFGRVCQPEFKICVTAVTYKSDKGASLMAKTTEDMDGKVVSRELCEFNNFGDVRKCVDWDRGSAHTDMKDPRGNWNQVSNN